MKVAVIGLGGTGVAAARFLARAGHEVVGFEQRRIGHARASSHGESRIIRYTYPDPLYTALMAEAYPLWDELEREAGESLRVRCGGVFLGPAGHPELEAIERSLRGAGHAYELLGPAETQTRFPALRLRREETAIYQAESGFLRATACVAATARLARAAGASLHEEVRVTALRSSAGRVRVEAAGAGEGNASSNGARAFECDAAIVAAGPWVGRLLADAGLPLRVTRQELVYVRIARNEASFEPEALPVWIDAATYDYGFPKDGRIRGVKLGFHHQGAPVDPDTDDLSITPEFVRERIAYAAGRFPDLAPEVVEGKVCFYTNTPDEDFILDRAPGLPGVWLASGCSGHGFKFTVLLGRIATELATGAGPPRDLRRFSLARFAR